MPCHTIKIYKDPGLHQQRDRQNLSVQSVSQCKILHVPVECGLNKYCSLCDKDIILCYLGAKFCCLWQRTPTSLVFNIQWCTQVHVIQFFFSSYANAIKAIRIKL